jgi:uncharacterized protein
MCEIQYNKIFNEVKDYLEKHDGENDERFSFRKRSEHIKRVFMWTKRLSEDYENINKEALLIAALFHDVGKTKLIRSDHAENSAKVFRD